MIALSLTSVHFSPFVPPAQDEPAVRGRRGSIHPAFLSESSKCFMAMILGFQLTWLFLGLGGVDHPLVQLHDAIAEIQASYIDYLIALDIRETRPACSLSSRSIRSHPRVTYSLVKGKG